MEYFTLPTPPSAEDPDAVQAELRRAWNACAAVACPKCLVAPWQYCRNRTGGELFVARFHKPRQDAAGAPAILAALGITGLSWAKQTGTHVWDERKIAPLPGAN